MIYGYVRISTDKQETDNQRFGIEEFAKKSGFQINGWIEETVSGAKDYHKRKLYDLMKRMQKGDRLVATELSRLGRNMMMLMEILRFFMNKEIEVWTIKDNYRLGNDITCQVLAFAFGLAAQIEREMISKRTKEALQRKREEGVVLGRPVGRKSSHTKLTGKEDVIKNCLKAGFSKSVIARKLHVHRITLANFIKSME